MDKIHVEVVYDDKKKQILIPLIVDSPCTISKAILKSGLLDEFPSLVLSELRVGVFSQLKSLNDLLEDKDRVEVYRPLTVDPKEARRARAKK